MKTREELEKMTKPEVKQYAKSLAIPGYSARIENKNGKKSEPTKEILIDRIMDFLATEPTTTEPTTTEPTTTEPTTTEPTTTEPTTTEPTTTEPTTTEPTTTEPTTTEPTTTEPTTTEPTTTEPTTTEPTTTEPTTTEPTTTTKTEGMNIMKVYEFLGFDQKEINAVREASKASGMSQESIIKSGILTRAKKISSEFKKTKDLSIEQLKQSTFIGAGHKIIKEVIDKLVMSNNAAYDNKIRVFINPSVVRSLTGCNLNSIKQVFDNYFTNDNFLETIDEHNSRHQLTNRDNKKGRDELGNRIKISDLIANIKITKNEKENMKLHFESSKIPTYQQFAAYIDSLEDEQTIVSASQELTQILREYYKKINPDYENSLHAELTKYRKEINNLKLKSFATFTHAYATPRTLKDGEIEPKGCVKNEEGKILNEPRHMALKYLVLTKEEQDKRNKK